MACAKLALSCSGLLSPWAPRRGPRGWWCHGGQLGPGTSQTRGCDQTPQCCPPTSLTHTQGDESPAALGLVLCLVPQTTTFLLPHLFVFLFIMHFAAFLCPGCHSLVLSSLPHLLLSLFSFTSGGSDGHTVMPQGWTSSPPAYEIHEERTSSLFKVLAVCSRDPVYLPESTNCCEDLSRLMFEVMLTAAGFSFPACF